MGDNVLRDGDKVEWIDFDEFPQRNPGPNLSGVTRFLDALAESDKNTRQAIEIAINTKQKLGSDGIRSYTTVIIEYNEQYPVGDNGIRLQKTFLEVTVEKNEKDQYEYKNISVIKEAVDAAQDKINQI